MRFGEVFGLSWKEYKQNFKVFVIVFLLLSVLPVIVKYFVSIPSTLSILKLGSQPALSEIFAIWFSLGYLPVIIFGIITFLLGIWMSASFIYNSLYRKKEMSVKETLAGGKEHFWRFFAFSIVFGIFLILLFLLAVIPGIIFMVFWVFASYIFIGENKGILESLKSSRVIVRGRWWKTFGWIILFTLISIAVYLVFSAVAGIINMIIGVPFVMDQITQANIPTTVPSAIIIIAGLIKQIFSLGASLIIVPLAILFFKNFYLDMKKSQVKIQNKKEVKNGRHS